MDEGGRRPVAVVLALDDETRCRGPGGDIPVTDLAWSLAASPVCADLARAIVVLRRNPHPIVGILGYLSEAEALAVRTLVDEFPHTLARLRWVDYRQVESACESLAAALERRLGRDALEGATFTAIPRGGLVVLGLLSYALRLGHGQIADPGGDEGLLIVVDDCALSGARFRRFLRDGGERKVVFAPLYSPPELRAAIEANEPRVRACVSGADLRDHAPDRFGNGHADWQARWRSRSEEGYWIGLPDHICFPWNEPDVTIWNPVSETEMPAWLVVSPSLCLKNRHLDSPAADRLQIQTDGPGPLRPADGVIFGRLGEETLIADAVTGSIVSLEGPAADVWERIVEWGEPERVEAALADRYSVGRNRLRADIRQLIEDLLGRGLLEGGGSDGRER